MFSYCTRLFKQITNLYHIKVQIDDINKCFALGLTINDSKQQQNFNNLKKIIFSCGSIYIKFFQWYISKLKSSIINDNTPETNNTIEFIDYFEDIFEQCPYHSLEHTKEIFKQSMCGIELEEYVDINTFKKIASGSIGQVYYAKSKRDGIEIAIKVKHPDITRDLQNQQELIQLIKFIQSIDFFRKKYNLFFNIDDFIGDINLQCDFNNEANNCKVFRNNFKDSEKYIVFPAVIYQSPDLLISEYIEGKDINILTDLQQHQLSLNFICFFFQMLLIDNFIHGDLHCKNWKIRINEVDKNVQIIVYDCGICFKNMNVKLTNDFWFSLTKYDIYGINIVLKKFILDTKPGIDNEKLENDIKTIFEDIIKNNVTTSLIMKTILNIFKSNNITVHKFLLNFSILLCLIEEFLKKTDLICRNKTGTQTASMFEIINDNQLDIIAFCDVKKCYPQVGELFKLHLNDKFETYKRNIDKCNDNDVCIDKTPGKTQLFSSILLSGLTFRPPE
jgi:predicted unusual protein kinase regulating ubiquinone biosynthesis (AarF/ABC1/UbiB family)